MRRLLLPLLVFSLIPAAFSQAGGGRQRIVETISTDNMVPLAGGEHPMARAENDRGRVNGSQQLHGVGMTFQRSAMQQQALDQLIATQQNPRSPSYHKWLTPAQFGARFGMSDADLASVTQWLEAQGLTVDEIAPSKNSLRFSGAVSQVERALATELHVYQVGSETHFANATAPKVPAALAGVVAGYRNLSDFRPKSNFVRGPQLPVRQDQRGLVATPQYTNGDGSHFLTPYDFAAIYDIAPLIGSSFDGTGESIAVMGQSAIDVSQVAAFQTAIGQTNKTPTQVLVPGSGTSTLVPGDEGEAEIDIEYAGGVARGANIIFVYVGNGQNFTVFDSLQFAVQNNTAPVITVSFSACEAQNPSALVQLDSILQQAVAQGQTIIASSGDSGAAGCDLSSATTATGGLSVNYPASSLFVTGVGGTRFNETSGVTYWNSSKPVSAIGYIPEIGWNDTADPQGNGTLSSTGGGVSVVFAKPSWQTAVGDSGDGFRDVPDISFAASGVHDGYLFCSADKGTDKARPFDNACVNGTLGNAAGFLSLVGGTSLSAPSFAAGVAILNQKLGSKLGFLNPSLYRLYAQDPGVFHDITSGNNQVPCAATAKDCVNGFVGYKAGAGYDLVTGLGSIDFNALETAAATPVGTTPTVTTLPAAPITATSGAPVTLTATVAAAAGAPTGNVVFTNSNNVTVASGVVSGGAATTSTSALPAGTYTLTAVYGGDATFASSRSSAINVTVTGGVKTDTATTVSADHTIISANGSTFLTLTAIVKPASAGAPLTGTVSFFSDGKPLGNPVPVNASGTATLQPTSLPQLIRGSGPVGERGTLWLLGGGGATLACFALMLPVKRRRWPMAALLLVMASTVFAISGCGGGGTPPANALALGQRTITATYSGDGNYNSSTSAGIMLNVQ